MHIGVLTSFFYHEVEEVHGRDRIVFGGAERYLITLAKYLQSLGHSVTVYQPLIGDKQVTKTYDGIPIICLPSKDSDWRYSTNSKLSMEFNELAAGCDLRIYFATFLCWPHVVRPAISISHGIFWDYPYHALGAGDSSHRNEFMRRQLYGFTAPDVCVAVDYNVKRVLAALQPGAEARVRVIPNFVDTHMFRPPEKKDWDGIRVLYPRRLTMLRGCNEFIRAAQALPDLEFVVCGNAADPAIEAKVAAWSETTPNLRAVWRPMDQMPEIYQQADIAVIPTRAAEGLSLSLLEAMASGLPIISTAVGGLGDAVIDLYNALLFDPDFDDLAEHIAVLAGNSQMMRAFGTRNRTIAKGFDIAVWQKRWSSLLGRYG